MANQGSKTLSISEGISCISPIDILSTISEKKTFGPFEGQKNSMLSAGGAGGYAQFIGKIVKILLYIIDAI